MAEKETLENREKGRWNRGRDKGLLVEGSTGMRKKEKGRGYREAGRNVKEVARKGDGVYRKRVASKRAHQGPTVLGEGWFFLIPST